MLVSTPWGIIDACQYQQRYQHSSRMPTKDGERWRQLSRTRSYWFCEGFERMRTLANLALVPRRGPEQAFVFQLVIRGWTSVSKSRIWTELRSWRLPALRVSGPGNPQRPTCRPSDRGTGASLFNTNTGDPLSDHRFKVGQCVNYTSGPRHQRGSSGVYRITQLLPSEGTECLYRIKSTDAAA